MGIAQWILIVLSILSMFASIGLHGKEHKYPHHAGANFIWFIVLHSLLYCGGFYGEKLCQPLL